MRKGSPRSELLGFAVLGLAAVPIFAIDPSWLSERGGVPWGGNTWLWFLGLFGVGVIGWIIYRRIIAPRPSWLLTELARSPGARAVLVLEGTERPGFTCVVIPDTHALVLSLPGEPDRTIAWSTINRIASRREPLGPLAIVDVTTESRELDLSFSLLERDAVSMASAEKTVAFISALQEAHAYGVT